MQHSKRGEGHAARAIVEAAPRRAGELMTTEVVSLYPHNLFRQAVDLLAQNPFRHLLVTEPDGRLVGVISDRDVLRADGCYDSETTLVADIMTPEPITVRAETLLSELVAIALDSRVNCFPVVDEGARICGVVTSTDLLRAFQNLQLAIEKLS